jgi:hypothetical protein
MAHCGYEATAVTDAVRHPLKALRTALRPIDTERPMAPEIPLGHQRPAEYVFERLVQQAAAPTAPAGSAERERRPGQQDHAA